MTDVALTRSLTTFLFRKYKLNALNYAIFSRGNISRPFKIRNNLDRDRDRSFAVYENLLSHTELIISIHCIIRFSQASLKKIVIDL